MPWISNPPGKYWIIVPSVSMVFLQTRAEQCRANHEVIEACLYQVEARASHLLLCRYWLSRFQYFARPTQTQPLDCVVYVHKVEGEDTLWHFKHPASKALAQPTGLSAACIGRHGRFTGIKDRVECPTQSTGSTLCTIESVPNKKRG